MKSLRNLILFIGLILSVSNLYSKSYSCNKWDVLDISIQAKVKGENPFTTEFTAIFKHDNGTEMLIPGFYNNNNVWILRFCPAMEGNWSYQTSSPIKALNAKKGIVKVTANNKSNRHGAVCIDKENKQRFIYEDGTPYFPLAFEIDWLFAIDVENKKGIPNTKHIVQVLDEYGLNKLIMNVYAYDANWGERDKIDPKYNFSKPAIFPFGGTNDEPDHSTLNVDFFKHFDRVMAHLHDKEMVSHLMIYVWNKKVNWAKPGSNEDNMYFDYVVKRYQAYPNLVWDISKEALAYGMDDMNYIVERIERLKKLDGHKRLVTVHDYSFCKTYPDLIDYVSIQEWKPNLYDQMVDVTKTHPNMPIYNVEHGAYEKTMHSIFNGAYNSPETCLERSYECIFAGTYTTYYWQNTSWYELVYEPFKLPKNKQPNFSYYKIMMDFFSQYGYNKLEPQHYFYSPYCLTDNKSIYIFLASHGMIALEGMPPKAINGKMVSVRWFNPLSGAYSEPVKWTLNGWFGNKKPASITSPFAIAVLEVLE